VRVVPGRRLYVTDAIVLSRFDYGEGGPDLVAPDPDHGKLRVIAKGCRRPTSRLGGSLEPLAALRVQLARGRTFDVVTQVTVEQPWLRLRDALEPTATAWYLAELADRSLEERHASEPVYLLLRRAYELLDAGMTPGRVARWYEMRLAEELGVRPEVDRCVECTRLVTADEPLRWVPAAGGVLCSAHPGPGQGSAGISAGGVRLLKAYQRMDVEGLAALRLPAATEREVELALADFLRYALEREPRSRRFLDEVRAAYRAGVAEIPGPRGTPPTDGARPTSGARPHSRPVDRRSSTGERSSIDDRRDDAGRGPRAAAARTADWPPAPAAAETGGRQPAPAIASAQRRGGGFAPSTSATIWPPRPPPVPATPGPTRSEHPVTTSPVDPSAVAPAVAHLDTIVSLSKRRGSSSPARRSTAASTPCGTTGRSASS